MKHAVAECSTDSWTNPRNNVWVIALSLSACELHASPSLNLFSVSTNASLSRTEPSSQKHTFSSRALGTCAAAAGQVFPATDGDDDDGFRAALFPSRPPLRIVSPRASCQLSSVGSGKKCSPKPLPALAKPPRCPQRDTLAGWRAAPWNDASPAWTDRDGTAPTYGVAQSETSEALARGASFYSADRSHGYFTR